MATQASRSKLLTLDIFSKTEEDVRIRTNTGGFITIGCIIATFFLLFREWTQFNEIITVPQLYIDADSDERLELNLDVTFPSVSCDILTLDIVDEAGDLQLDLLDAGFKRIRVSSDGKELSSEDILVGKDIKEEKNRLLYDSEYCGSCYGARDQSMNDKVAKNARVCCQSCDEVHNAYINAGWAFFDGKDIEQCEQEGYVKRINEHLNEGCRVIGSVQLGRVQGNIHFAPGKSYQRYESRTSNTHFHDTSLYEKHRQLNFNHIINHLSFGKPVENINGKTKNKPGSLSKISRTPLDGYKVIPERNTHYQQFSYFAKVVPTRYEYLNDAFPATETMQFSVTYHSRPLQGGRDEDHPTTIHSRGGIPGLFIYYQMSPLKVIDREEYAQTWSTFLLNCVTTIGGVLAVGTFLDRVLYKAQRTIWGKKRQ